MLRFFIATLLTTSAYAEDWVRAAEQSLPPIDQREIALNSCGVVAQLNSYRASSNAWRDVTDRLSASPKKAFKFLRSRYYQKISKNAYSRQRWEEKIGMRPDDLRDGINEFHKKVHLPPLRLSSLFCNKKATHRQLLQKTHQRIHQSLKAGFPPILYITRFAKVSTSGGGHFWSDTSSHFITISSIPTELEANADSFRFEYIDSWRGRVLTGSFQISAATFYAGNLTGKNKRYQRNPTLELVAPQTSVGAHFLAEGTPNTLSPTHLIYAKSAPTQAK